MFECLDVVSVEATFYMHLDLFALLFYATMFLQTVMCLTGIFVHYSNLDLFALLFSYYYLLQMFMCIIIIVPYSFFKIGCWCELCIFLYVKTIT